MSKNLYFPTYIGLLSPEHYKNIGSALWEFLWFISKTTKEVHEDGEMIGIVLGGRPIKNTEIAEELGISLSTVERNVSKLRKQGYITTRRTPYGNVFKVRNSKKFYKNIIKSKSDRRTLKSDGSEREEVAKMKREPSNVSERTLKNGDRTLKSEGNKEDIKDIKDINKPYVEIIDYLNKKTGKRYSPKSAANQKLINGRMSEGRTLEDFKHVIDVKVDEWLNNEEMQQYLRPATLFRPTNFENYLNQKPKFKAEKQSDPRDKEIAFQKWMSENPDADPNDFDWETGKGVKRDE